MSDTKELLLCLRAAATLPCDPRLRSMLVDASEQIEADDKRIAELEQTVDALTKMVASKSDELEAARWRE